MGYQGGELNLLHHPTGTDRTRSPDWIVMATNPRPADELYFELKGAATSRPRLLRRVGDCLAPRRAHAAVIDGNRVGAEIDEWLRSRTSPARART